jgi:hypothetical protein
VDTTEEALAFLAQFCRAQCRGISGRRVSVLMHEGGIMPLIKPRTRGKQLVRHIVRLDRETNETLFAYAHFLGEPTDYVLNQVIDTVLAKDKEFQSWRAEHRESFVPRAGGRSHRLHRARTSQPTPQASVTTRAEHSAAVHGGV